MHYPNLTFHGVEATGSDSTHHRCLYGWQPERKPRGVAIAEVLLPEYSRFTGYAEVILVDPSRATPLQSRRTMLKEDLWLGAERIGLPHRVRTRSFFKW